MSTEIDELEKRIASLEKEFRAVFGKAETIKPAPGSDAEHPPVGYRLANGQEFVVRGALFWSDFGEWKEVLRSQCYGEEKAFQFTAPIANPIPANEGDSRLAESVAIPVGWVRNISMDPEKGKAWDRAKQKWVRGAGCDPLHCSAFIFPDPSIPWGEGYEAILPEEHRCGDEFRETRGWMAWTNGEGLSMLNASSFPWRRKVQPEAKPLADRVADSIADDVQNMQAAIETLTDERHRALARVAEVEAKNAKLSEKIEEMEEAVEFARILELTLQDVSAAANGNGPMRLRDSERRRIGDAQ